MPSLPMQTSTPPIASVIFTTLPKLTFAAKGIDCSLRSATVFATQASPPYENAELIGCLLIADVVDASARVQDGMGI